MSVNVKVKPLSFYGDAKGRVVELDTLEEWRVGSFREPQEAQVCGEKGALSPGVKAWGTSCEEQAAEANPEIDRLISFDMGPRWPQMYNGISKSVEFSSAVLRAWGGGGGGEGGCLVASGLKAERTLEVINGGFPGWAGIGIGRKLINILSPSCVQALW